MREKLELGENKYYFLNIECENIRITSKPTNRQCEGILAFASFIDEIEECINIIELKILKDILQSVVTNNNIIKVSDILKLEQMFKELLAHCLRDKIVLKYFDIEEIEQ